MTPDTKQHRLGSLLVCCSRVLTGLPFCPTGERRVGGCSEAEAEEVFMLLPVAPLSIDGSRIKLTLQYIRGAVRGPISTPTQRRLKAQERCKQP
jgi:hypothetical protein